MRIVCLFRGKVVILQPLNKNGEEIMMSLSLLNNVIIRLRGVAGSDEACSCR